MAKLVFKVRNAKFIRIGDMWPKYEGTENANKHVLLCFSDGICAERGLHDGQRIRTSTVVKVSDDKTKVETLNSIYHVSSWED